MKTFFFCNKRSCPLNKKLETNLFDCSKSFFLRKEKLHIYNIFKYLGTKQIAKAKRAEQKRERRLRIDDDDNDDNNCCSPVSEREEHAEPDDANAEMEKEGGDHADGGQAGGGGGC